MRAVAGTKPLLPLFEVRTRRRTFSLEAEGLPPGEIALDETAIHPPGGGPPARLRRVEIEVPEAACRRSSRSFASCAKRVRCSPPA